MNADDLRGISLFDGLSGEQLSSLAAAGEEMAFQKGDVLWQQGKPAEFWWVLLAGRIDLIRQAGHYSTVVGALDQPGRWAGGFRAWDDSGTYIATGRAETSGRVFRIPAEAFGRWARSAFPLGVHLIEGLFRTVRSIEAMASEQEALIALGRLAAGLAHEINNPASAAVRGVDALQRECETLVSSLAQLAERSLSPEKFAALDALRREIDPSAAIMEARAAADREEALTGWLDRHRIGSSWRIAPILASSGVDVAWCERVGKVLTGDTLEPGLTWLASTLSTSALLAEMKESTSRISALVAAIKSYSQLDRALLQVIDVTEGIESTLVMLAHKLRPGVTVVRDYGADVPKIEANPGELNQVWTNLIDNAIDAMDGQGMLRILTRADGDSVVVEIIDSGPGMAPEVQAHAFEPFFTTKEVGKGTGLGLDISRRVVAERHGGAITIDTRPGETVLRVRLPQNRRDASE
jgi:signal transduction histidine kinase